MDDRRKKGFSFLITTSRGYLSPEPVMRRLLPPLAVILFLIVLCSGAGLWQQHKNRSTQETSNNVLDAKNRLKVFLDQQAAGLVATTYVIAADRRVQTALRSGDADTLLVDWRPVYETLHRENKLTHFYFFDKNRVCLLRVHKPEKRGDVIGRFTALEAERTGKTASGIELGPLDTFTLRVVRPVLAGGELVGYVELGKEIEDVLETLHSSSGNQIALSIHKKFLNRQTFEDGMRLLGREADWDRLSNNVVIYASQGKLPDAFALLADRAEGDNSYRKIGGEVNFDGKTWVAAAMPVQDASGAEVGELLVMRDVSAEKVAFVRMMAISGAVGIMILVLLLSFVYVLLRRTDVGIRAQQEEIKESEKTQRLLMESIDAGVVVIDPATHIIEHANYVAAKMFGSPIDSIVGRVCHNFLCPAEEGACPITDRGQNLEQADRIMLVAGGRQVPVMKSVKRIQIGGRDKLIETFVDITDRKRAEAKLLEMNRAFREATERANAASLTKSRFLANMSHEIRTPMNSILGYGELLGATALSAKQMEYVKMISSSGTLLLGIIDDILDVSKFEAGKVALETVDFNLDYLCHDVFKMILPRIKDSKINTYVRLDKNIPLLLKGDPTRLRQILINLLGNAVKFTKKGEIGISVFKEDIPVKEGFAVLRFIVKDTGSGIPPGKREAIFNPFTQADESTTRKYGGTGLGLTICKTIVEAIGGKIWVESEEGKGCEFIFTIPLALGDRSMTEGIDPVTFNALKGKRIIIVDDHQSNTDILRQYCRDAGMDVMRTYSGANEAWKGISGCMAAGDIPNVILSDIMMPDMSGNDLAKRIRDNYGFGKVKLIAVTSDVRLGTAQDAHESGFDGYLPKPVSREELLKVIATVLGDKRKDGWIITRHVAEELQCKGVRILVAEDTLANKMLMQEYLNMLEVNADFVNNGEEAIAKLKENQYDLCLMDIQMPVMDGITATRIIRQEISKDLPVIAVSADVMQEDKEKSAAAGLNDYLTKPVDLQKLKEIIVKWKGYGAAGAL
ncbi:MAG: response regulator [Candidatus Omnitrophica bacterium]|nr:response regulator [Candidatus Omnitrophota bacterium]